MVFAKFAPGGGFHTEEWYGHLNGGGVASVIMPLWYMGRFTDYCSDLDGKMAIYPIPVWNEGDTREVFRVVQEHLLSREQRTNS